ncbi:MAG: PQQ-binding-like beta-propeller repeat protein [Planctomycetota bacterium]
MTRASAMLIVANVLSSSVPCFADWPSFLGGVERDKQSVVLPTTWSSSENITWKSPLPGHGQSSPVVVGGLVYVTAIEGPNKDQNIVLCFDLASGQEKWRHAFDNPMPVKNDPYTSRAAPSPVADESGVYAFFESGDLLALTKTGEVRWERNLATAYGEIKGRFGLGGSVAQVDDKLFVLADNSGPSYLVCIEKESGKEVWKADRESRTAWSSPMILNVGGKPQVVVSSAGPIQGYDVADGSLLWELDGVGGNTVASPLAFGDGLFLVGASPGRNGENTEGARKSNMAVKVTENSGAYQADVLWRNEDATSSFGSPIVYRGKAYYVSRAGVVYCMNAETGEKVFYSRIAESTWATPLGSGDHVYFFGQTGNTTVLKVGDEFEKVSVNRLYEESADGGGPGGFNAEIQYGVALCDLGLVVRTGENLYLVGAKN